VCMYSKILAATDLSDASIPALKTALELGRRLDAKVTVVHVTEPAYPANHWFVPHIGDDAEALTGIIARELEEARRRLEGQVQSLGIPGAEINIRVGRPAWVIVETARDLAYDLIVLGTHNRKGIEHVVLGSVAERVVRTAACPVLVVPAA
jgi:nucleotide-binding universal stress UspA family protein